MAVGPSVMVLCQANRISGQPERTSVRWDVPPWRLTLQPIRSSAAKAFDALTDGQLRLRFSGGNEGNVHGPGQEAERQRLDGCGGLRPGTAIRRHTGERGNVGQPAPILFAVVLDGQGKSLGSRRRRRVSIMPPKRFWSVRDGNFAIY